MSYNFPRRLDVFTLHHHDGFCILQIESRHAACPHTRAQPQKLYCVLWQRQTKFVQLFSVLVHWCYLKRPNSLTFCFGGKNNASHLCGMRLITIPSVTYWHQYHYHICIFNFWLTRQRPWPHYLEKDQHLISYLYVS